MVRSILKRASWRLGAVALAVAAMGFVPGAQAQNVLTNGSFEGFAGCGTTGTNTGCDNGTNFNNKTQQLNGDLFNGATGGLYAPWTTTSGYTFIVTPSQAINGFTGNAGSVSLWSTSNGGTGTITASPDGGSFLVVDPAYQTGVLSTTLTGLVTGATYTVSWYTAASQQQGYSLVGSGQTEAKETWTLKTLNASGTQTSSQNAATISNGGDKGFSGWVQQSLSILASTSQMTLQFIVNSNVGSSQPPFALLDGVSVVKTTTVPEPTTMVLFASGIAGLAVLRRRRARA